MLALRACNALFNWVLFLGVSGPARTLVVDPLLTGPSMLDQPLVAFGPEGAQ
jgi:hypothetical protein